MSLSEINMRSLQEAITECQEHPNPNAEVCKKLAAYLTIYNHLKGEAEQQEPIDMGYSYATTPSDTVSYSRNSEFARAINGKKQTAVFDVMTELMDCVYFFRKELYNQTIQKLMKI